jgi:hypothetical protein
MAYDSRAPYKVIHRLCSWRRLSCHANSKSFVGVLQAFDGLKPKIRPAATGMDFGHFACPTSAITNNTSIPIALDQNRQPNALRHASTCYSYLMFMSYCVAKLTQASRSQIFFPAFVLRNNQITKAFSTLCHLLTKVLIHQSQQVSPAQWKPMGQWLPPCLQGCRKRSATRSTAT